MVTLPHPPHPLPRNHRAVLIAAALSLGLLAATASPTMAADAAAPAPKAAKPATKPATPRQQLKSEAKGLALATQTVENITESQLLLASRVLTGTADCEFNQRISVEPVEGRAGHFHVGFKGQRYTMVPEETSTGAVRLFDRKAGVVWLQIPTKSMLMNAKLGQRMVDACTQVEQRLAMGTAAAAAGGGIGIVPVAPAAAPAATQQ